MTNTDQDLASKRVNFLAARNSWPLIGDPHLRFVTPQLKTALEVWRSRCGSRTMPSRADMTIRDLKTVLPNLAFLAIERDGAQTRFKVRLAGCALDDFLSGRPTGHFIDEAVPERFAEKWSALWQATVDARAPARTVGRVEFPNRRYYMSEAFYAPLAQDGETPDMVMLVAYFHGFTDEGARDGDIAVRLQTEIGEHGVST